jgi:putative ABC transport system permease protein
MTLRDLIGISSGNLWRMKLRTVLTTAGVVIAIAAFVSMLSFGAGNQKLITDQFNDLGLFNTMQVYPKDTTRTDDREDRRRRRDTVRVADTIPYRPLDLSAIDSLAKIPGVNFVFPYDAFAVFVTHGDSTVKSKAQAMTMSASRLKIFSRIESGEMFASDTDRTVLVTRDFLNTLGVDSTKPVIGDTMIVTVKVSSIDSAFAHVLSENGVTLWDRVDKLDFDSLWFQEYRQKVISGEANAALQRFVSGYLRARTPVSDTFVICGVLKEGRARRLPVESIMMPAQRARRFTNAGFTGEISDMIRLVSTGRLLRSDVATSSRSFPQVTLDVDPSVPHAGIRKQVEAMGFRTFSYAEQFEEIQKAFFYFDLALGAVGLIALFTASLAIVNTMVFSILERRREIGILKSLGADESDIRRLFLVESGVIGILGATVGLFFGWVITRIVTLVAHYFMRKEGVTEVEIFALPWWLILGAIILGLGVSLIAGLYPASRAARVDPVEALRGE